ncbi:MAG: peptidyl-prolyl cis-trans isomerase [Candidatus Cloacimonetes bacterium]|nr:peptidyl-prolyl cis-trans isomerase [Candidatus Cloacimonadota bacterium]
MKKIIALILIIIAGGIMLAENPVVNLSTNLGDITIELYQDKAPVTVENFLKYTNDGYYNDTVFHRVIAGFMIQGGGFTAEGSQKETMEPIKNEADNGLKNLEGTIAMARTQVVDSATSQFFINCKDNSFLDHGSRDYGYCVFGKVIKGMDIVKKIETTATGAKKGMRDWPLENVIVNKAEVVETKE